MTRLQDFFKDISYLQTFRWVLDCCTVRYCLSVDNSSNVLICDKYIMIHCNIDSWLSLLKSWCLWRWVGFHHSREDFTERNEILPFNSTVQEMCMQFHLFAVVTLPILMWSIYYILQDWFPCNVATVVPVTISCKIRTNFINERQQ